MVRSKGERQGRGERCQGVVTKVVSAVSNGTKVLLVGSTLVLLTSLLPVTYDRADLAENPPNFNKEFEGEDEG